MRREGHNLFLWLAAAAFVVVIFVAAAPRLGLSILPGFEGLNAGVEGAEVAGAFYRIDVPLPSGYTWLSSDPRNTVINKDLTAGSDARVRVEVGSPLALAEKSQKIDYWVKDGDQYVHVTGEVVQYSLPVTISAAITGTNWPEVFSGEKIWIGLHSLVWDKALQEQSPISGNPSEYGQAWEAPIGVYITSFNLRDAGDHGKITPAYSGRYITLYSTPAQSGTIGDLMSSDLNATFAGDLRPDSRMQRSAYFPILLEDFGTTTPLSGIFGTSAPVADYELKVYVLRIGKFTYTNPDDTPWGTRQPDSYDPLAWLKAAWNGLTQWFSSPINLLGTFIVLGIVLAVAVLVFLFMTGLIIPLRAWSQRRRSKWTRDRT